MSMCKPMKECANEGCTNTFQKSGVVGQPQKYCCVECRNQHNHKKRNRKVKTPETAICANERCGEPFTVARVGHIYCCPNCTREVFRQKKRAAAEERKKNSRRSCARPDCTKLVPPTLNGWTIYCGDECRREAKAESDAMGKRRRRRRGDFVGQIPGAGPDYFAPSPKIKSLEVRYQVGNIYREASQ